MILEAYFLPISQGRLCKSFDHAYQQIFWSFTEVHHP